MQKVVFAVILALGVNPPAIVQAQSNLAEEPAQVGQSTGLPIPRYVSLKTSEGYARRGPSYNHRIDWVYERRGVPLRVTGEFENWRRVEDADGEGGWVHYTRLSGVRTVLVQQDLTAMRSRPRPDSHEVALLELGVIADIEECNLDWCRLSVEGESGWVDRRALWGVAPGEILE